MFRAGERLFSQVCPDLEREAAKAAELGMRMLMLRTGIVLGPRGRRCKMLLPFRLGLGGRLGSGRQWMSWIHLKRPGRADAPRGTARSSSGPVNGVSPNPVTRPSVTRALAGVLHRPAFFPVPPFALRLAIGEFAEVLLGSQRGQPSRRGAQRLPVQISAT